jgi:hypothetical protein
MIVYVDGGCRCCDKAMRTGDMWHCEYCWNEHHNGRRDKDFLTREEYEKLHEGNPAGEMITTARLEKLTALAAETITRLEAQHPGAGPAGAFHKENKESGNK